MSALTTLDRLVGVYVRISRPRTALEEKAYGGPGEAGGGYFVVSVGPLRTLRVTFGGEVEELVGRDLLGDEGMGEFVTADTRVEVLDDPNPEHRTCPDRLTATPQLPDLRAGVYRHYKGHIYQVTGYVMDSTNGYGDRLLVAYTALQVDGEPTPGPRQKVRQVSEFFDLVWPTGVIHHSSPGVLPPVAVTPRFTYLGPAWSPEMSQ